MPNQGMKATAFLPLRVENVEEGEFEQRRQAVLFGPQIVESYIANPSRFDRGDSLAAMATRLDALEKKIDAVLALLLRQEQNRPHDEAVALEIWGEGMSFRWPSPIASGQRLELHFTISWLPPIDIHLLAEVTDCLPELGEGSGFRRYRITTTYVAISENQQNAIYRFLLASDGLKRRQEREEP